MREVRHRMREKSAEDIDAETAAARARFDEGALVGRPVDEARRWCQARGFLVLVEQEGGVYNMSRCTGRVRLTVRDGVVIGAGLG